MSQEIDPRTVRFEVEVLPGVQPITGRLIDAAGAVHDFQGWIELIQAIERATVPEKETE